MVELSFGSVIHSVCSIYRLKVYDKSVAVSEVLDRSLKIVLTTVNCVG